jgi:hypothetical protein
VIIFFIIFDYIVFGWQFSFFINIYLIIIGSLVNKIQLSSYNHLLNFMSLHSYSPIASLSFLSFELDSNIIKFIQFSIHQKSILSKSYS